MSAENKPLAGQRIGLFGRGGSGKSTCTVLVAKALARAGYAVCVVDADSTNEGLAQALGADKTPDSLLDWLGGTVFSGGPIRKPAPKAPCMYSTKCRTRIPSISYGNACSRRR